MKILVLSNFYPPHHIGGYGMLCKEVVDGLRSRGHTFKILTTHHGINKPEIDGDVYRLLALESNLHYYKPGRSLLYPFVKQKNLAHLHRLHSSFQPDLIFIWGMWSLSKELAAKAEQLMGNRVVYYIANPWPIEPNQHQAYWDMPATRQLRRVPKMVARIPARLILRSEWNGAGLQFRYAPCCSEATRQQLIDNDVNLQDSPVIYEGIELDPYLTQSGKRIESQKLRLLFVGILAPHKGVHTIIEALAHLSPTKISRTSLTILGSGHPQYEEQLRRMVIDNNLSDYISFHSPIPRDELPDLLGQYDVLLLPSTWEEPLARIMQEGLASGMTIVGSATGGTKEIIINEVNGLLFPPEDSRSLAYVLERLIDNPGLHSRLAENGVQTAREKFDIGRMVDEINSYLIGITNGSSIDGSG